MTKDLWTWKGKYFDERDSDDLWTHDGRHVGRFDDNEVYGPDGLYLGEVMDGDRLISHRHPSCRKSKEFAPRAPPKGQIRPTG